MSVDIQILNWDSTDIYTNSEELSDNSNSDLDEDTVSINNNKIFVIRVFGRKINGDSVSVLITGFTPFFYIKVEDYWNKSNNEELDDYIRNKILNYKTAHHFLGLSLIKRNDFIGFTNGRKFKYVQLRFKDLETMNKCKYRFKNPIDLNNHGKNKQYKLYESNIPPMLRFIHINSISASGWVRFNKKDCLNEDIENITVAQENYIIDYKNIKPLDSDQVCPLRIASYDIESDSSHGDFPVAKKNYKKLALNIIDNYNTVKKNKNDYSKKMLNNKNNYLSNLISFSFQELNQNTDNDFEESREKIDTIYTIDNIKPTLDYINKVVEIINPSQTYKDEIIKISQTQYKSEENNIKDGLVRIYSNLTKNTYDVNISKYNLIDELLKIETHKNETGLVFENKVISNDTVVSKFNQCELLLTSRKIYKYPEIKIKIYPNNLEKINSQIVLKEKIIWQWDNNGWWLDFNSKSSKSIEKLYKNRLLDNSLNVYDDNYNDYYDIDLRKKILVSSNNQTIHKIRRKLLFDNIRYNHYISSIKERIEKEFQIPIIQQVLLFNGRVMEDTKRLTNYNYFRGGILDLTIVPYLDRLDIKRDDKIVALTCILDKYLPKVEGDKIIQIGTVIQTFGVKDYYKNIITLKGCSSIEDVEVESYDTEKEVILAWARIIMKKDPDIITGYNIFGFDYSFIWNRALELGCEFELSTIMSRDIKIPSYLKELNLSSSAYGDNEMTFINIYGRIQMDLLKVIQRDHKLDSYSLDTVSNHFINGSIMEVDRISNSEYKITTDNIIGLVIGNFIKITEDDSKYHNGEKIKILEIIPDEVSNKKHCIIVEYNLEDININEHKYNWGLSKDDVSPKDIFELQKKGDNERGIIAKYCVQDCVLCLHLVNKLDIITNNMGMSNVCKVPLSYIFLRGQGIKTTSLVAEKCRRLDTLIPDRDSNDKLVTEGRKIKNSIREKGSDLENEILDELLDILINEDPISNFDRKNELLNVNPKINDFYKSIINKTKEGYEGAIVLDPIPGIYFRPITTLDYGSLYPSSMISENLSHDTIVKVGDKYIQDTYIDGSNGLGKYDNIPGIKYIDVTYDNYLYSLKGKQWIKYINPKTPKITCRYAQPVEKTDENGKKVIDEKNRGIIPQILNEILNARKRTRNKIKTEEDPFKISVLDGLQLAYKITANSIYGQIGASTSTIYFKEIAASTTAIGRKMLYTAKDYVEKNYKGCKVVYGDTDSIFVDYNPTDENGKQLTGKEALEKSMEMGLETEKAVGKFLKHPHKLEYEKIFYPFCLITKKRYVGRKYEFDMNKYKLNAMGIVLKRRDNAKIVKYIYGGIIDRIMEGNNIEDSIKFLQQALTDLLDGKFSIDYLIITKSLKSYYKNPEQIAHKVLADRMGERDPGNKPKPSDRIPYVYIEYKNKKGSKVLQGDKVEHPQYVIDNNLKLDYLFYITNQIMKPVCQIYGLIQDNPEKLFEESLRVAQNKRNKTLEITNFFKVINKTNCSDNKKSINKQSSTIKNESTNITDFFSKNNTTSLIIDEYSESDDE